MNRRNFLFTVLGIGALAKMVKPEEKRFDAWNDFYNGHKSFFRSDGVNTYIPSNLNEFNFKNNRHKWKSR